MLAIQYSDPRAPDRGPVAAIPARRFHTASIRFASAGSSVHALAARGGRWVAADDDRADDRALGATAHAGGVRLERPDPTTAHKDVLLYRYRSYDGDAVV